MKFSEYFQQRNVKLGLIFNAIVSIIAFLTTFTFFEGVYLNFDLQFFIGSVIGVIYALRNRTSDQKILSCGIIVGIFGGIISAFLISLLYTLIYYPNFGFFLFFFIIIVLTGIPVGILGGGIISVYFMYLEMKSERSDEDRYDDDFYKDLIKD
ncbi:MAG: hypothetical protein ACFFC3_05115 [Candidatus Odinarchaeota archaeon]